MSKLSQLILPVKDPTTGEIEYIQFDLPTCYIPIGVCTSAASTQNKTVTIDGDFELVKGVRIAVKFSNTNTYKAAADNKITLNVNNTGAKYIYYNNTASPTGTNTKAYGYANRYNYYIYDGTYWVWDGCGSDDNTTYSDATTSAHGLLSVSDKKKLDSLTAVPSGEYHLTFGKSTS